MTLLLTMDLIARSHAVPSGPPPEVLDEVAAAWGRAQDPTFAELTFASVPAVGRAWGELRHPDGTLLASTSASEAIAIACGDAPPLAAPALAA
jgi:hypothetical protein